MNSAAFAASIAALVTAGCGVSEDPVRNVKSESPIAEMQVLHGTSRSALVYARLSVPLSSVVDLSVFDGFAPKMTAATAELRFGSPNGTWDDPFCRARTPYYDRRGGRVVTCQYPTSGEPTWGVIAYPASCTTSPGISNARVLKQIRPWLPADRSIDVHLRGSSDEGMLIRASHDRCEWVMLLGGR